MAQPEVDPNVIAVLHVARTCIVDGALAACTRILACHVRFSCRFYRSLESGMNAKQLLRSMGQSSSLANMAIALLLASCGGTNIAVPEGSTADSTPAAARAPASNLASEIGAYPSRLLSADESEIVEFDVGAGELGPGRSTIAAQSFAVTVPESGEIFLIATRSAIEGPSKLHLDWRSPTSEGGYFAMPVDPEVASWSFFELRAVAFGDFNRDGLGPDVITIAEYVTGIGPTGAQPFPIVTVYFYETLYSYTINAAVQDALREKEIETIDAAKSEIDVFFERQPDA